MLTSCQKTLEVPAKSIAGEVVSNDNGVWVEPCHSTAFSTNYSTLPGKVPPFRFTKTHYTSGRVRTINMLSRANPNHSAFKQQAWEVIGTFTYNGVNEAYLVGTKQLWEYYKTSSGAAARKSIIKKNINLTFKFFYDYSGDDYAQAIGSCKQVLNKLENNAIAFSTVTRIGCCGYPTYIYIGPGSDEPENNFQAVRGFPLPQGTAMISSMDDLENLEGGGEDGYEFVPPADYRLRKRIRFTTTTNPNAKSFSYQPTQNWISLEYTILEAMNWTSFKLGQRATVSVEFYPNNTSYKVVQSQKYLNHKYDSKGNLLSYTYADNVLQKTTWLCKTGTPPPEY